MQGALATSPFVIFVPVTAVAGPAPPSVSPFSTVPSAGAASPFTIVPAAAAAAAAQVAQARSPFHAAAADAESRKADVAAARPVPPDARDLLERMGLQQVTVLSCRREDEQPEADMLVPFEIRDIDPTAEAGCCGACPKAEEFLSMHGCLKDVLGEVVQGMSFAAKGGKDTFTVCIKGCGGHEYVAAASLVQDALAYSRQGASTVLRHIRTGDGRGRELECTCVQSADLDRRSKLARMRVRTCLHELLRR